MTNTRNLPIDNDATLATLREIAHDPANPTSARLGALRTLCNISGLLDKRTRTITIVRRNSPFRLVPNDDDEDEIDEQHAANVRIVNDLNQIALNKDESPQNRLNACALLNRISAASSARSAASHHAKSIYRKPPRDPNRL